MIQRCRTQIAFYGSTRNYAFQFDDLGFEGTSARLNERQKAGDLAGMAALITDEMLEHFAVIGPWDDVADALQARYGDLADAADRLHRCRRHPPRPVVDRTVGRGRPGPQRRLTSAWSGALARS